MDKEFTAITSTNQKVVHDAKNDSKNQVPAFMNNAQAATVIPTMMMAQFAGLGQRQGPQVTPFSYTPQQQQQQQQQSQQQQQYFYTPPVFVPRFSMQDYAQSGGNVQGMMNLPAFPQLASFGALQAAFNLSKQPSQQTRPFTLFPGANPYQSNSGATALEQQNNLMKTFLQAAEIVQGKDIERRRSENDDEHISDEDDEPADEPKRPGKGENVRVRSTLQMTNYLINQMRTYDFFHPPKNRDERIRSKRDWKKALVDFNRRFDLDVSMTAYRRKVSHLRRTTFPRYSSGGSRTSAGETDEEDEDEEHRVNKNRNEPQRTAAIKKPRRAKSFDESSVGSKSEADAASERDDA